MRLLLHILHVKVCMFRTFFSVEPLCLRINTWLSKVDRKRTSRVFNPSIPKMKLVLCFSFMCKESITIVDRVTITAGLLGIMTSLSLSAHVIVSCCFGGRISIEALNKNTLLSRHWDYGPLCELQLDHTLCSCWKHWQLVQRCKPQIPFIVPEEMPCHMLAPQRERIVLDHTTFLWLFRECNIQSLLLPKPKITSFTAAAILLGCQSG